MTRFTQRCVVCNSTFFTKPWHIKQGWGKCCSSKCRNLNQQTGKTYACGECGKDVYRSPAAFAKSLTGKVFCSHHCSTIASNRLFKSGYNHPNYINGNGTYRDIAIREYGLHCQNKEKCPLNDKVVPDFVYEVDHIDNNRRNNKIENLRVLCAWCHRAKHYGN